MRMHSNIFCSSFPICCHHAQLPTNDGSSKKHESVVASIVRTSIIAGEYLRAMQALVYRQKSEALPANHYPVLLNVPVSRYAPCPSQPPAASLPELCALEMGFVC